MAKNNYDLFSLAYECHHQFCQHILTFRQSDSVRGVINKGHKIFNTAAINSEEKRLFGSILAGHFGSMDPDGEVPNRYGNYFNVYTKKE